MTARYQRRFGKGDVRSRQPRRSTKTPDSFSLLTELGEGHFDCGRRARPFGGRALREQRKLPRPCIPPSETARCTSTGNHQAPSPSLLQPSTKGSGRGCPSLRASDEHILIVRVLRARRAPGRPYPLPPSSPVFSQGWGLIDVPLRATFSPAHPLARRDVPVAQARVFCDRALREHRRSSGSIPSPVPGAQDQRGCPSSSFIVGALRAKRAPGRSLPILQRPRIARAQRYCDCFDEPSRSCQ